MPPPAAPLTIAIAGCAGRMGRMLVAELRSGAWPDMALAGGTLGPGDAPPEGVEIFPDARAAYAAADALIDFTVPAMAREHAAAATHARKTLILGTSGLTRDDHDILRSAAGEARIVAAPNMALGVNLLLALAERAAAVLGDGWDAEILDLHHRHKVDAPSGTSYALAQAVARGRGGDDPQMTHARHGYTGPRAAGAIGFAVQRGGDVVAENTLTFFGPGERLELTHRASDRAIFARGALAAARWAAGQPPGLYTMRDVLGV